MGGVTVRDVDVRIPYTFSFPSKECRISNELGSKQWLSLSLSLSVSAYRLPCGMCAKNLQATGYWNSQQCRHAFGDVMIRVLEYSIWSTDMSVDIQFTCRIRPLFREGTTSRGRGSLMFFCWGLNTHIGKMGANEFVFCRPKSSSGLTPLS
jgi:hypothetical protein